MKQTKKLASLLLALVLVFALSVPAFAQDVDVKSGNGSITISNAAKGETYTIYKLFDATVTGATDGSIAYTGTIPSGLTPYFAKDTADNISATDAAWKDAATKAEMSDGLRAALTEWVKTATATKSVVSDGSELKFTGLAYGYYVVTTTQGNQAISVDSTNPTATIVDKNSTSPTKLVKSVNDDDVSIGDTVTYTVSFETANYDGAGTAAKKIVSYTIEDTLPAFLTNVNVTSIIVDDDGDDETTGDQHNVTVQFTDKKIVIDWYDEDAGAFLYDNGATVTITYTAVVTDEAAIAGAGNTNEVTVTWNTEPTTPGGNPEPGSGKLEDEETIYTYAIALKKVNDKGEALAGAVFQFPFYVQAELDSETNTYVAKADTDGAYIYAGTTAGTGLTNQITTPESGVIVVKGVASGDYEITEVTAPNGYNKLTAPVTVTAEQTSETSTHTTTYLDKDGNIVEEQTDTTVTVTVDISNIAASAFVVVNKTGAELPETGGMGTTIFYVLGSVLLVGAAVLLITKKRMSAEK